MNHSDSEMDMARDNYQAKCEEEMKADFVEMERQPQDWQAINKLEKEVESLKEQIINVIKIFESQIKRDDNIDARISIVRSDLEFQKRRIDFLEKCFSVSLNKN